MKETLAHLVELQAIEDELRDLRQTKNRLEAATKENAEAREVFEVMLAERAEQIDEVRAFCGEKEAAIKEAEENTRRARTRLSTITSQRELTALNKELDAARRQNSQQSEELLKLMEQLEAAQADFDKKTAEFEALKQQMADVEGGLNQRIAERESGITAQRERQQELRKAMDPTLFSRFNRTVKARKGIAVVPVGVDGTCTGCRMQTPPQQWIRIQSMESIEYCQHCRRILVDMAGFDEQNAGEEAGEVPTPPAAD